MPKKKSKKNAMSAAMFKLTGSSAKIRVNDKKRAMYYFSPKVDAEKAVDLARRDGADILGVSPDDVKVGRPSLKYDFYCIYDATMEMKYLRVRTEEISVNEEVAGVLVGKEVLRVIKGREVPGKAIRVPLVELFAVKRSDSMILDGTTGAPARSLERLLKGPGRKRATMGWLKKAKVSPGRYNSLDKVVRAVTKVASAKPSGIKRVVTHTLDFKRLDGFYVPTYYVRVSAGDDSKTLRINAVSGNVAVKV